MPTGKRHYRLTWEDVLEAHAKALEEGGCPGILNKGLIESALARPYDGRHRLIHQKAAAVVHSVAKNHGFTDGNKRTAFHMVQLLIHRSGYLYPADSQDVEDVEGMILAVVENRMSYSSLEEWFKKRLTRKLGFWQAPVPSSDRDDRYGKR